MGFRFSLALSAVSSFVRVCRVKRGTTDVSPLTDPTVQDYRSGFVKRGSLHLAKAALSTVHFLGMALLGVHIGLQFLLGLLHPPIAHGFVFARIGLHLGAIDGYVPQLHQSGLLTQLQGLHKQFPSLARCCFRKFAIEDVNRALSSLFSQKRVRAARPMIDYAQRRWAGRCFRNAPGIIVL